MKELFSMWSKTRLVVLTAVCAAVYAAVLIPFKIATIIPGITEIRPAVALPVVLSFMFGPAGAWGAAFGNLIGDFFGTLGPGSVFGFIGNFLYGYIPYKAWKHLTKEPPLPKGPKQILRYLGVVALSSSVCGVFIGWGVDLLGIVPLKILANIITLNNFLVSAVLGPVLVLIIYPRVEKWRLLYTDILKPEDISPPRYRGIGPFLLLIGGIGGLILINLSSLGLIQWPANWVGLTPAILFILLGTILL